jgi:predicted RNA-binding protein with PIN domain
LEGFWQQGYVGEVRYAIDAFNLAYKFPVLEEHLAYGRYQEAREGLNQLLKLWMEKSGSSIYLFYDGYRADSRDIFQEDWEGIKIYYSHKDEADKLIRDYYLAQPNPKDTFLITSDKKILQFARSLGVRYKTSEVFSDEMANLISDSN